MRVGHTATAPLLPSASFRLEPNPCATPRAQYGARQSAVLNPAGLASARACISAWPNYAPTPLIELPGLAARLGVGQILYKQESERFGLRSFKPLGGAYAVQQCLLREIAARTGGEAPEPASLLLGAHAEIVAAVTVTAATDGNHGRSVAWGARMFGCRCVIYVNAAVTEARERAIAAHGAEVRRHPGSFDDAVRQAFEMARTEGWHVIPDTSDGVIVEAPRDVMQGYSVMAAEAVEQLPFGTTPSHVFLQAGVGGMAAAVCGELWQAFGADRPITILVEPSQAACWLASLLEGRPTAVTGDIDSFMSGLACGEVSALAWEVLQPGAHAAMAIADPVAEATMRLLAEGHGGDTPVVAGESGVAGLAGLIMTAQNESARRILGLGADARILVFGTEGATDEALYQRIVGRPWTEVGR